MPRSVIERGSALGHRLSTLELAVIWLSGALFGVLAGLIIAAAVIL
jgi:hypothetical protein